jgi:predicted GIY-YIG superfamily endonuclease
MSENQQQEELDFQRAIALAEDLTGQVSIPIPPRWNPPPALCNNQSCVYMIELKANPPKYYVGETDALSQRLKKHRSKGEPWSTSRAVAMPVADKSEARAWESRLIQKLAQLRTEEHSGIFYDANRVEVNRIELRLVEAM